MWRAREREGVAAIDIPSTHPSMSVPRYEIDLGPDFTHPAGKNRQLTTTTDILTDPSLQKDILFKTWKSFKKKENQGNMTNLLHRAWQKMEMQEEIDALKKEVETLKNNAEARETEIDGLKNQKAKSDSWRIQLCSELEKSEAEVKEFKKQIAEMADFKHRFLNLRADLHMEREENLRLGNVWFEIRFLLIQRGYAGMASDNLGNKYMPF